jgi:hypothetical protein
VLYPDRGIRGDRRSGHGSEPSGSRLARQGLELPDWLIAVADRAVELEQTA